LSSARLSANSPPRASRLELDIYGITSLDDERSPWWKSAHSSPSRLFPPPSLAQATRRSPTAKSYHSVALVAGSVMLIKQNLSSVPTRLQCLAGKGHKHIVLCQVQSLTRPYRNKRPHRVPSTSRKSCDARPLPNLTILLLFTVEAVMLIKQNLSSVSTGLQSVESESHKHIVPCQVQSLV